MVLLQYSAAGVHGRVFMDDEILALRITDSFVIM